MCVCLSCRLKQIGQFRCNFHCYANVWANYVQNIVQHPSLKVNSICRGNYWGSSMWVPTHRSTTDHLFCIRQMLEKKWEYNEVVHQLFIVFKKAYDSVRREVLYNILMEFGIPKKLIRLIKMCLTETYSRVRVDKNLSDMFPIRNSLKQSVTIAVQLCFRVCH